MTVITCFLRPSVLLLSSRVSTCLVVDVVVVVVLGVVFNIISMIGSPCAHSLAYTDARNVTYICMNGKRRQNVSFRGTRTYIHTYIHKYIRPSSLSLFLSFFQLGRTIAS